MIKISYEDRTYGIDADAFCYSVGLLGTRKKKTNGDVEITEEYIVSPKFPTTLRGCIETILKLEQRRVVDENNLTLKTAFEKFERLHKYFELMLTNAIKESLDTPKYQSVLVNEIISKGMLEKLIKEKLENGSIKVKKGKGKSEV